MTDIRVELLALIEPILERTKDQIGTHSPNCHEYHIGCLAFAIRHRIVATLGDPYEGLTASEKRLEGGAMKKTMAPSPEGDDIGAKLDRIIELLEQQRTTTIYVQPPNYTPTWPYPQVWCSTNTGTL